MTDPKSDVVIIFAGYPGKMKKMITPEKSLPPPIAYLSLPRPTSGTVKDRAIKSLLFHALLCVSFVCLARPPTHSFPTYTFIVELGQYVNTPHHNLSIKPEPNTFFATPAINTESPQDKTTETINTDSYSGSDSDSPPDDKPYKPGHLWESLTTVVESVSWRLLYASNEVIGYRLLLTLQEGSYQPKPFSWMPVVATVVVGWLSRSYWNPEAPMFNQLDEQATNQKHEIQIITLMYKSGAGHSSLTSTSDSNPPFNMRSSFTGLAHYSFIHHQGRNDGDGPGWPTPIMHSRDESCLLEPCRKNKRCIYAPDPINQHSDLCRCQACMAELDKFTDPPLLMGTAQCDSTYDGSIFCNLNHHPQTGGQSSVSNSVGLPAEVQTIISEADSTTGNLETSQGEECGINGCPRRFTRPSGKKSHQAAVHGVGGKKCGITGCSRRFIWFSQKKSHQARAHGMGGEECGIDGCMERFTWPSKKKHHQADVHDMGGEECGINGCPRRFTKSSRKKSHQARAHGVGGEECGIDGCMERFAWPSRKKHHQAGVHSVGGEECGINGCPRRFTRPSDKKLHQARMHGADSDLTSKKRKRKHTEEDND